MLVPTMGALHAGHAALIDRARLEAGRDGLVVVSIFVNPTQFGPKEDLSRYPRPFAADRKLCATHGVNLIFRPSAEEMYAADSSTYVEENAVAAPMCGASRPGHFRGVCTVVLKLFNIVQPHAAVFGLKDYQQCAVIRRMVRDLDVPLRIIPCPTVREGDGLALSSRNVYLTPEERAQAPVLRRALLAAEAAWRVARRARPAAGVAAAPARKGAAARRLCGNSGRDSVAAGKDGGARNTVMALAVFFGRTRLIDNLLLK